MSGPLFAMLWTLGVLALWLLLSGLALLVWRCVVEPLLARAGW